VLTRAPQVAILATAILIATTACSGSSSQPAPPPTTSHSLAPVISNQWYSDVFADFPTYPLYALPGAFQLGPQGLGVSMPAVTKTPDAVFAAFKADLVLGTGQTLGRPRVTNVGDWSVGVSMSQADGGQLSFTLAHGAPFTALHLSHQKLQVRCVQACSIFVNDTTPLRQGATVSARALTLVVGSRSYMLAMDRKTTVALNGDTVLLSGSEGVFLGLLDDRKHFGLFQSAAGAEISGTTVEPAIVGNELRTTYTVHFSGAVPLLAVYPHQAQFLTSPPAVLGSYPTIRGDLTLIRAGSFTTTLPLQRPPAGFAPLSPAPSDLLATLAGDVDVYIRTGPPSSKDYYLGVWFGRGIDLFQVAQAAGRQDLADRLISYLEPQLVTGLSYFHYDAAKASVIAGFPEFGNENLNDHHFHYGYYIRAGAILSLADPKFMAQIKVPLDQMVADIATYDRASSHFPYLRTFDVYEGHSWADGYARFGDGNDQESSSEAINAWYGTYLWSLAIKDSRLETTALYLYNTEVESTKEYWFGASGVYTPPYRHRIASIVWGGKADFVTWFSKNPNAIYGIQLVALTPASSYLGQLGGIDAYLTDLEMAGGSLTGYWGDLIVAWLSFYSPQSAISLARSVPDSLLFGPRSLLLYFVYRNAASGQPA
jgi:endo-1,3(4)-beta-glucanase